jgi:serine/threonine protein kinase
LRYASVGDEPRAIKSSFALLSKLAHSSISPFVELFDLPTAFAVASDYFDGYALRASISEARPYSEDEARGIFSQVLEAVDYLHESGLAHRNLSTDHILIDDEQHIRLIGWSYLTSKTTLEFCRKPVALCWDPPESLAAKPVTAFAADSWALGVLLYFLVTGRLPWLPASDDHDAIWRAMASGNVLRPQKMSLSCHHLIARLLDIDPMRRYSPGQARVHAWTVGVKVPKKGCVLGAIAKMSATNTIKEKDNRLGQRMRRPRGEMCSYSSNALDLLLCSSLLKIEK